jgi:hypothetical protein
LRFKGVFRGISMKFQQLVSVIVCIQMVFTDVDCLYIAKDEKIYIKMVDMQA